MRKKVKYSVTRYGRNGSYHFNGIGEIDEENLYTEYRDKYGETQTHVYEDCLKDLAPVIGKPDQYKGGYLEYEEYHGREQEIDYQIWLKLI